MTDIVPVTVFNREDKSKRTDGLGCQTTGTINVKRYKGIINF